MMEIMAADPARKVAPRGSQRKNMKKIIIFFAETHIVKSGCSHAFMLYQYMAEIA